MGHSNTLKSWANSPALRRTFFATAVAFSPSLGSNDFAQGIGNYASEKLSPVNSYVETITNKDRFSYTSQSSCSKGAELQDFLGNIKSTESDALLSYISQEGLSFCHVHDNRLADKYDEDRKIYTLLEGPFWKLRALEQSIEHSFFKSLQNRSFNKLDYKSQLIVRLAVKAYAEAYAGIIAFQYEHSGFDDLDIAFDNSIYDVMKSLDTEQLFDYPDVAVTTYIRQRLLQPEFYKEHSPLLMTNMFEELYTGRALILEKGGNQNIWAEEVEHTWSFLGRYNTFILDDLIPDMHSFEANLGKLSESLNYLDAQRYPKSERPVHFNLTDLNELADIYIKSDYQLYFPQVMDRLKSGGDNYSKHECAHITTDFQASQLAPEQAHLWTSIQRLNTRHSYIGSILYGYADKHNMPFCVEHKDSKTADNRFGNYALRTGIIRMRAHDHPYYNHHIAVVAAGHEVMHALQDLRGTLKQTSYESISNLQMRIFSAEAAAYIVGRLIAYEMQMEGFDNGPWKSNPYEGIDEKIHQIYQTEIKNPKVLYLDAIEKAGSQSWSMFFDNQEWVDRHNKNIARAYIKRLRNGKFGLSEGFTVDDAREHGHIHLGFNIISGIESLPDKDQRFGSNHIMRALFNAIDLETIKRVKGEESKEYTNQRTLLAEEGNPFLDINFYDGRLNLDDYSGESVYNQLICEAGLEGCNAEDNLKAKTQAIVAHNMH